MNVRETLTKQLEVLEKAQEQAAADIPLDVSISFGLLDIVASVGAPAVSQSYYRLQELNEKLMEKR